MTGSLVLIRHAQTQIDPEVPSKNWRLAEGAYADLLALAGRLEPHSLTHIVTSEEHKAQETGRVVAESLGVPWAVAPGLHEHERAGVPYVDDPERWQRTLETFFGEPDRLVFGTETATEARERFEDALLTVLEAHDRAPAVVSHATVMSLFVAHHNNGDAYAFWRGLKMPSLVALSLPSFELTEIA